MSNSPLHSYIWTTFCTSIYNVVAKNIKTILEGGQSCCFHRRIHQKTDSEERHKEMTPAAQLAFFLCSFGDFLWRRHVSFPSKTILMFFVSQYARGNEEETDPTAAELEEDRRPVNMIRSHAFSVSPPSVWEMTWQIGGQTVITWLLNLYFPLAFLKGHWHEIFCTRFFESKLVPQPPDSYSKAVSNINSNSPRYSNSSQIPLCGPPWRIWSYNVAPPVGSLRWTCMWGKSHGVAPPGGSNPKVCPPPPPPGDPILRCGPSQGTELSAVAPAVGSTATPRDHLDILWGPGAAFKGTIYEECVYGGTIPHKDFNIQALDLL